MYIFSGLKLFGPNSNRYVCSRNKTVDYQKNTTLKVKHGGGSIMMWGVAFFTCNWGFNQSGCGYFWKEGWMNLTSSVCDVLIDSFKQLITSKGSSNKVVSG